MASLAFVFFAALSLNLFTYFGCGIRELSMRERPLPIQVYYPWAVLFLSTTTLWFFFARVLVVFGGIFDYMLTVPLAILGGKGLEKLCFMAFPQAFKDADNAALFSAGSAYNGLSAAALILTLRFALSFGGAVVLSFSFSLGGLLSFLAAKEIQKRSFLETIPRVLRGKPLLLISMGLLSLIFSAASVLLLKIVV